MVKNLSRWLILGATIAGVILVGRLVWLVGWGTVTMLFDAITSSKLLFLMLFPFVTALIATFRWQIIIRAFGIKATFLELFGMMLGGRAIGYLIPGGTAVELTALSFMVPQSSLPVVHGVASIVVDGFIRFATNTTMLFAGSLGFLAAGVFGPQDSVVVALGVITGVFAAGLLILLFREKSAHWLSETLAGVFPGHAAQQMHIFRDFRAFFRELRPRAFAAVVLTVIGFLWEPFQVGILLSFLGEPLPFWQVFWLYHAILFPRLLPVPAGVGFSEAGGTIFSQALGIGGGLGLTTGLLVRLKDLPAVFVGLLVLLFRSLGYTSKK